VSRENNGEDAVRGRGDEFSQYGALGEGVGLLSSGLLGLWTCGKPCNLWLKLWPLLAYGRGHAGVFGAT